MDRRDAFDVSLRELNRAFDAVSVAHSRCGEDSLAFARAHERYRIAVLKWKSDHTALAADGARVVLEDIGRGRRVLVLSRQHEPVAESIFSFSLIRGFDATLEDCANLARCPVSSRVQLAFLDGDCHIASKVKAIELIRINSPQCRIAVLSRTPSPFTTWPGVDAVIDRPTSLKHIVEVFCQLVATVEHVSPVQESMKAC
ncbi:hypothetical protein KZJ38_11295 [Paraburkholderia edwinii]|jgi:hypothetical protein|uniref:Response regulatory domain-containing protein n=1 Tax=Paraburkholderia edwinii TaxID=2861782 RepID=A0ABX8UEV9_9BURK|nr:hypothetical protein [Paraburkholderia edwinii]QYD67001.1 hypothetical protein KZJ38_11295 [Paraburkholderia edwinii]